MCFIAFTERDIIMRIYRKALILLLSLTIASFSALCGCSSKTATPSKSSSSELSDDTNDEAYQAAKEGGLKALGINPEKLGIKPVVTTDSTKQAGYQLDAPAEGETVAVVKTNMGNFSMRFFPEVAPKAVGNFLKLAKSGKYNNTIFHRVINGSLVQGGHIGSDEKQPNGESASGAPFADEFCDKLLNIRGAVSMANSGRDTNGSQFFVNQTNDKKFQQNGGWSYYDNIWKDCREQLKQYKDNAQFLSAYIDENGDKMINTYIVPNDVKSLYVKKGGNPNFDGAFNAADRGNTVFAQVYSGMPVVDKIAAIKVDNKNVPKENVIIKSVEITKYSKPKAQ